MGRVAEVYDLVLLGLEGLQGRVYRRMKLEVLGNGPEAEYFIGSGEL